MRTAYRAGEVVKSVRMSLTELLFTVFLLNLPFGYLRSGTAPYSRNWLLAVHIPVPFIFVLRKLSGFTLEAVPLLLLADVAGQLLGGKLRKRGSR